MIATFKYYFKLKIFLRLLKRVSSKLFYFLKFTLITFKIALGSTFQSVDYQILVCVTISLFLGIYFDIFQGYKF